MNRTRSLVGFIDLSLILLGSVALIGELQQRELRASEAIKPREAENRAELLQVSIGRLFEPDEARLSVQGASWVTWLARRADGRRVAIRIAPDDRDGHNRLDGWEQAAARTAAIMYALETAGYPSAKVEPAMPRDGETISGVTITLRD